MALIKAWASYFRSTIRMRGRQYQVQGKVHQLSPQPGEMVRATVRGSREYTVLIRDDGSSSSASCTCPLFASGQYCKHIWAVLVDVERNGINPAADSSDNDSDSSDNRKASSADDRDEASGNSDGAGSPRRNAGGFGGEPGFGGASGGGPPQPPKARKREPGEKRVNPSREPEWVGRLSLLRYAHNETVDLAPAATLTPRQVCYIVNVDLSLAAHTLVIELNQHQMTRAGWGSLKPLKLTADQLVSLPDPEDRELCALILGGRPRLEFDRLDPHRAQESFALPIGARRALLQRLVHTGRSFITGDEVERDTNTPHLLPLIWDNAPPWVLWLVGTDDGQDLIFQLELRRGETSMPIARPRLLLGGPDGVVFYADQAAAYEERDAAHWAEHFRTGNIHDPTAPGLRVPLTEVDRFLERLYLLPNLPEIDLPEGLGRAEQHLDPVPHLELATANSPARPNTLTPALPKNLLLARLWFAYGPHRITPGTLGRFVVTENTGQPHQGAALNVTDAPHTDVSADIENNQSPISNNQTSISNPHSEIENRKSSSENSSAPPALIRRNLRAENEAIALAVRLGFRPDPAVAGAQALGGVLPARLMPQAVAACLPQGWVITADRATVRTSTRPSFAITSGLDWFELRGGLQFTHADGTIQTVALPDILAAAQKGQTLITLGDGSQGLLPEDWLKQHGLLATIGKVEGDHLRFTHSQAALLDALLDTDETVEMDDHFAQARQRLHEFAGIHALDAPPSFLGQLRPYQRDGLGWLAFLRTFGMGGILADDMGLGKTIQVLAMLANRNKDAAAPANPHQGAALNAGEVSPVDANTNLKSEIRNPKSLPSLVIAPRSVVFNWIDEAQRFTPHLKVHAYAGTEREAQRQNFDQYDLIITTYGLMRRDIAELTKCRFDYVFLDEAQAIKNPSSQVARAARTLPAGHRLALTGTPVENHLGDLWSIFEFLNPGILGGAGGFIRLLRNSIQDAAKPHQGAALNVVNQSPSDTYGADTPSADTAAEITNQKSQIENSSFPDPLDNDQTNPLTARNLQSALVAAQIGRALKPFILRRTKKQVLKDLPAKTEQTILCQMENGQRETYNQLLAHYRGTLLKQVETTGLGRNTIMVLEALLRLRQAACHPGLIDPKRQDDPSAKTEALLEQVEDLIAEGHKALIFSQFTSFLAIVRKQLDARGIPYEYLDGQTRQRRQHVQRFQTDPACPLFLISLKAGGLGLNLTAAEYVFILDPWWNPAVENQAIDRAHRIGQTRHVFAYRLICQDTVEQRIAQLQDKKRQLAEAIVGEQQDNILQTLTRDDLELLLS